MPMFGSKKKDDDDKSEGGEEGEEKGEEGGEAKKKDAPKKEGGVGAMKSGDYMVHVFVEKLKEINMPEGESTIDPMFIVECLGQKIYSSAKDDVGEMGESVYNEHLFLEPRGVDKKDADDAKIMIKLVDKGMFKDHLIGQFELDLSFIYLRDQHLLLHKWFAFSNPNGDDYAKIQCYTKLSISVSHEQDKQVQIEDDTTGKEDPDVMMSPALNPRFFQTKIRIFSGHDLPMMDSGIGFLSKDKIDAYLKLEFKGKKYKTPVKKYFLNDEPCTWNKEFWLPTQMPVAAPEIAIRVMDEDDIGSDEMACSMVFKTKDIIENKYGTNGQFYWKNLYGSPMNQSNSKAKKQMNEDPSVASHWKGRVLVQITTEETDKPLAKTCPIEEEVLNEAKKFMSKKKFAIIAEIGQAVSLPSEKKYDINIIVGGQSLSLKPKDQKKPVTYKRYERTEQVEFDSYNQCINDFSKVIVQLMDGSNPICYFKAPIQDFLEPNPELKWYQFIPDVCVKKCKEPHEVGQFSMKLCLHNITDHGPIDFSIHNAWNKKSVIKRANAIKVRAYVYQARDLPAADAEGTSDPYIKIWDTTCSGKKFKRTEVVEDNCNPLFYECIELDYEVTNYDDLNSYPPFIFDIFDHDDDLFDSTPDFMCRCIVEPEDCAILMEKDFELCKEHQQKSCAMCAMKNEEIPKEPRWHPCSYSPGGPKCGELLVSFSVSSDDYRYSIQDPEQVDLAALVPTREFNCSMNILGMRQLASPGLLPVKKAFVKFNIKSLVPPHGPAVKNIQTTPNQAGKNPTLNTTMKFFIPLPTEELYCPRLTCTVYDNIFAGWNQPIIGIFTLPIGQLMFDLATERSEETGVIELINEELSKILGDENMQSFAIETLPADNEDPMNLSINNSMASDQKLITKKRKKVQKSFGAEGKQLGEEFDAKEEDGLQNADSQRESALDQIETQRQKLLSPSGSDGGRKLTKAEIKKNVSELSEKQKRLEDDEKKRNIEDFIKQGNDPSSMIIMPQYVLDERLKIDREVKAPPGKVYIGLGWDENAETKRRHYRKIINGSLEEEKDIFERESPFNTYLLKKGQSRGASGGLFSSNKDASGQVSTEKICGIFKGVIEVENKEDKEAYLKKKDIMIKKMKDFINQISINKTKQPFLMDVEALANAELRSKFELNCRKLGVDHLNISKAITNLNSDEILKRALLKEEKCIVRFYAVDGYNMASRDNGSPSDTYLALECNGHKFNERDIYQLDEPCPKFYKMYDFEAYFPGSSPLKIECWDYDAIFGDELIGASTLDLEDRYFTLDWIALKDKPVETRPLFHPSSAMAQGYIKCWVEINKVMGVDPDSVKEWDITPKPPTPMEIRICVLNCMDIPMMDAEGTCDAYFRTFFDTKKDVQETDTHFRNQDGKPDFQYRTVYKIEYPPKVTKFTLQGYDRDFFKSNDIIGEATIELNDIMEDVSLIKNTLQYNKKYYTDVLRPKYQTDKKFKMEFDPKDDNKIWLQLWGKNKKGKTEKRGKVAVKVDVVPQGSADKNPVGKARDTPNHGPTLPPPEGRIEFSFNPIKMFNQLVGPALRRKIYMGICCALCCALFIMILPNVLGQILVGLV